MQASNRNIKDRTLKPIYLLLGEEAFLKKSYKSRLREALTDGGTINHNYFKGKGMNVGEIIGLVDTMPFFVEKRLVLMEDGKFFKGGIGADGLTEYMGGVPESTCLILIESEVDKRSRLYKAVEKYGYATKLSHQEPAQLARWVTDILSKDGRKITGRTMEFFLSKAEDDMENTSPEPEKLTSYTLGREIITDEDMEAICTTQVTNKVFDTITAIAVRQTRKAMDLYGGLLMLKEPPMHILFLIARQSNQILQVKDLMGRGVDKGTVTSRLKFQPFVAGEIMLQIKTSTREQILSYVNLCVNAEEGVKIGKPQGRLAAELLIANKYK